MYRTAIVKKVVGDKVTVRLRSGALLEIKDQGFTTGQVLQVAINFKTKEITDVRTNQSLNREETSVDGCPAEDEELDCDEYLCSYLACTEVRG